MLAFLLFNNIKEYVIRPPLWKRPINVLRSHMCTCTGHATYKGLYIVGGSPRKGHLFQVYERVGVSLVLSIWKGPKKVNRRFLWLWKRQEKFLVEKVHLQQLKGTQSSELGLWKWYHLSIEGIRKGDFFCRKWYIKG